MSDTESEYPTLPSNLFNTKIEYKELSEQSPTPTNPFETPLPFDKRKKNIPSGGSSSRDTFSFSAQVDKKTPINVKLDSVGKLTEQDNYMIWSASMTIILKELKTYDVLVYGVVPAEGVEETEVNAYNHLYHTASTIFIQVVSQNFLEMIVELEKPNLMWTWLRTEYYRDSAYALDFQIMNLVSLPTQYSGNNLSDFISKFDAQWLHLTKLSKGSSDSYGTTFAAFLTKDQAKREFMVGFLVKHHKNVIDNLTTKDSLWWADVTQRLMDIDTSESDDNTALFAFKPSGNQKRVKKPSGKRSFDSSSPKSKTCTWCKKHNAGKSEEHTCNECFRLQKLNKEKKEKETEKDEEANIKTEIKVRNKFFYFDMDCTSHMIPYGGCLLNITKCSGFVKSSLQESMDIVGKGDVIMECVLRDGLVSSFRVCDVLHIPKLGYPPISWRKLRSKGYSEFGVGDFISVNKGKKFMFEAVFDGNLFKISEISHPAHITYNFWHQAFGHLAASWMDTALKLYSDADIPAKPKDFICDSWVKSKMIWESRLSTSRKDWNKLNLVHSDLSGPFPVPSDVNSLYYISLIDDATRVAWVRFMKQKSETTNIVKDFVAEMEHQYHKTLKAFRTDNGGEYVIKDLAGFFESKGIIHEFTHHYSPQSNRVAERLNRSIGEALRAMLESAVTYDKKLWAEAVLTTIYIKNHQPHSALKDLTSYKALYDSKPSIQHLQPFGRECYTWVHHQEWKDGKQLSLRAQRAILTEYTNTIKHYRVILPNMKKTIV
jgi:transposase InsO family protein